MSRSGGPLPVVVVDGPEDSEPTVIHTQARRVGQRLQVRLDGIVPVSEQELELCTRPQVARVGPIDDLVGSAATGSGQLVEGQSQS